MVQSQIGVMDMRLIASLSEHLVSGYEKSLDDVSAVIVAVQKGKIRITRSEDILATFEDLAGDCFNPDANPSVDPDELKRDEDIFRERIKDSGSWIMTSEYWTGREWEAFKGIRDNSIGGFVGYDFFGSGYELQVMQAALEAYNNQDLDSEGFVIDPFRKAA